MNIKGFDENVKKNETLMMNNVSEKPLKTNKILSNRVDINVLKSKLKASEKREFKKNLIILIFFLATLGSLGIYLSY
tara:strand:+ start:352 stop:582 length:231 start_codon:yes stop_codon:yes gene_type:complete